MSTTLKWTGTITFRWVDGTFWANNLALGYVLEPYTEGEEWEVHFADDSVVFADSLQEMKDVAEARVMELLNGES